MRAGVWPWAARLAARPAAPPSADPAAGSAGQSLSGVPALATRSNSSSGPPLATRNPLLITPI